MLTRYADVERAVKDDDTFSSHHSTEAGSPYGGIIIPPSPSVSTPIEMDPPDFTPLRKLLNPYFSPGKADEWEAFTRDVTTGLIDEVIETGQLDFVDELASPVPAIFTAALLGIPLDGMAEYADVSHAIVYTPPSDPGFAGVVQRLQQILERATEVCLQRRAQPQDDLLSAIVTFRDSQR